jgi:hypothetical protein
MNIFSELIPLGLARYLTLYPEENRMISPIPILFFPYDSHLINTQPDLVSTFYTPRLTKAGECLKKLINITKG